MRARALRARPATCNTGVTNQRCCGCISESISCDSLREKAGRAANLRVMGTETAIQVIVDNRMRMRSIDLPKSVLDDLRREHEHANPKHFKLQNMGFKAWKEPAVIKTWRLDNDASGAEWFSIPRGGSARLRKALSVAGLSARFVDARSSGDRARAGMREPHPAHRVTLWEHQERIVESVLKMENCVVRSGTGSGKTTALLAAISRAQVPAIVVVWETGLLRQWQQRIERELGLSGDDVGMIGGGVFRLRPITMAMQQSLNRLSEARWKQIDKVFGMVAADELSRFAAETFRRTIDRFSARFRIGMSADETRRDGKEFLIYDMFGSVAIEIDQDELVEAGIVHDVEIRIVLSDFRADWYVESRDSFRFGNSDGTKADPPDFNRLLDEMLRDEQRNKLIVGTAAEATAAGRKALIFAHRIEHCRRLDSMLAGFGMRSGVMVGEDGEAYAETVQGLWSGDRQIGVGTYGKIGMGLDLPAVAAGIAATPCHNNRPLWKQITGRLCRTTTGKSDAVLYYIWDRYVHGIIPILNIKRWSHRVFVRGDDSQWIEAKLYLQQLKGSAR